MTATIDGKKVIYHLMGQSQDDYPNLDLEYLGYGKNTFGMTGHFFLRKRNELECLPEAIHTHSENGKPLDFW